MFTITPDAEKYIAKLFADPFLSPAFSLDPFRKFSISPRLGSSLGRQDYKPVQPYLSNPLTFQVRGLL